MSIIAFAILCIQCFMLLIFEKSKDVLTVFLLLGSGGFCFGLTGQLMQNLIMDKPPILHLAGVFIAISVIVLNNKKYLLNG